MTDPWELEAWMGFAVIGVPVAVAAVRVWWKVESGQNTELSNLQLSNHKDHEAIRKEISAAKDLFTEQNGHLRDLIQGLWEQFAKDKD